MESLSRPLHRRKLSNVNSFSGKNAYDGVFSGHRRTHGGAPAVSGDDYREIFAADCSIPVLDLSAVGEASDGSDVDYGKIFGGFRELEIAVSYEEMVARDKDRAPSSTSQSPQDVGDLSRQSSDALKQYNMSYNKISQRNKDGLDGTTHVTQLHAVPGFTCFIDESASQPDNETVKQKSSSTNNVNVKSSKRDTPEKQTMKNNYNVNTSNHDFPEKQTTKNNNKVNTSKRDFPEKQTTRDFPEKQTTENNNNVNTSKRDFPEKQTTENNNNVNTSKGDLPEKQAMDENNNVNTSTRDFPEKQTQTSVEFRSKYQEESLSSDKNFKTFEVNFKSHPSKVLSPESKKEAKNEKSPAANIVPSSPPAAPQPKNETEKQKSSVTNIVRPGEKVDIHEKQTSQTAVESQSRYTQDESLSDDITFKPFHTDFKSHPPKVSSSPAASATNLDNHKDYQKRSTAKSGEFPRACFDEELDVNSAAAASTAALRKAIEKAQESIRIAKESVGRKKEGRRGFSSKRFKDSLKHKARVANVNAGEEQKAKDDKIKEMDHKNGSTVVFPDFADFAVDEKLFGTKKVVNEIHGKTPESVKNYEMPIKSSVELNNNTMVCSSKHDVGKTETKSIEHNTCEDPQKNNERPDSFLVLESCEDKLGDIESNNLTVCQKVEIEKEISQTSDQNGFEKKSGEESFRLLENNMQENLEQKHDSKVVGAERQDEDERQVKEDGGTESHSEEEKFYDVCEVEMIKNAQTYANSIDTNDLSRKENYENHKAEETFENSSSDYDDAENENATGTSNAVDDSEEACKVDQVEFNAEISRDIDDVSCCHSFQVDYKEPVEKVIFEDIASDETKDNKEECEAKSDNLENCGLTDMDFGQNDTQFESFVGTIHGMEIEVKECKEREEIVEKEENNLQPSLEETPEIRIEMDTGTPQEPKDACREPEPSKVADDKEEKERERIKLAVERAIREARERAFLEVRQRVIADTQEKVTKASIDKISAQSKLRAERALVERATAEARQRALERAMRTSEPQTQVNESKQTSSTSQTNTESALRSKAKLEKHNRIMERAAKALAEKEKRDLLALKEQAERNRLSETLDADIKRWSTGKEGNLRALLSTLQYILGADSGWQPVSLTEIITTSAVKKAYRKATLCVHPDKLQQRGASIQQKYICEKVFDLLKAAWNRFNSEER